MWWLLIELYSPKDTSMHLPPGAREGDLIWKYRRGRFTQVHQGHPGQGGP